MMGLFYVDRDLISEKRINKAVLQEKKIFLRIRSSGSAGKSYHDITLSELHPTQV